MNEIRKNLEETLLDLINGKGFELIEIEQRSLRKGVKIVIYIDHELGIVMDDCVSISKMSEDIIDEFIDPESYELEVSSPGLDRKLIKKEDFDRYKGKTIKIKLKEKMNDRKNFKGVLADRRGDLVFLEDDEVFEIPMDRIDICRIVPQFN
ncbi:MAG: ribosome maturation factor RimP [Gammaproteobacteria bacterium]|jgi:ribosome maturation factor RimP|nr:ribosome maturation factor RimP [Gammaproteobacteria bacterium]MBQ08221.1 ribosome maturation factor RimP [Gammaproteobacteria bacterium]MDP6147442.1 ribosome maturation factor RimP [Gammaproteobacteria bacterium]HJL79669.1 ribosome maturation factor RimP [Gammaproteobacteria bacterium]HJM09144.1 ribosome maturation factor RimP [Gammaproteobacteria bacterium]|tara:strand:- start:32487 stop:32939 length:453 start_codon:yes stop_codon:yes gene_type:complete